MKTKIILILLLVLSFSFLGLKETRAQCVIEPCAIEKCEVIGKNFHSPYVHIPIGSNYAYVATGNSDGLYIIDITNHPPTVEGVASINGSCKDVFISGNYAYVAVYNGADRGLLKIDINSASASYLNIVGRTPFSGFMTDYTGIPTGVVVKGNYAYVSDGIVNTIIPNSGFLHVININQMDGTINGIVWNVADGPLERSTYEHSIDISGNYVYVETDKGLKVIDINSHNIVWGIEPGFPIDSIFVQGNYVYGFNYSDNEFLIIDKNSHNIVGTADFVSCGGFSVFHDVYVLGNHAYVAGGGRVWDIDVTDPTNPKVNTYCDGFCEFLASISVVGNDAYVPTKGNPIILQVLDITKFSSCPPAIPVDVTIEAEDKNGVLIPDGGAIWDYDNGPVTILSSASTSGASILLNHIVEVKIGAGLWTPLFSCSDTLDNNGYCDFHPAVNISNLKLDDGSDIPQMQIGPFPAGTVINYRSSATDSALPPNIGSSAEKSFTVGTTWAKAFGGVNGENASSIQQTSDSGYIVTGYTGSYGTGSADSLILKLDSNGVQEWAKTFGGANYDYASSIQQTSDSGYIMVGYTESYGAGNKDFFILKLDSNGVQEWAKTFGGANSEYVESIQQTSDGGYIIAGYTESYGAGNSDSLILKLDSNGVQEWAKTFGGANCDYARSIQQTSDGGYIVAGYTESYGTGNPSSLILKLDSNGVQEWAKTFGGANYDYASSVQQTSDGGYIIAGYTGSYGAGGADFLILKLDSNGVQKWVKTFGGTDNDSANSIQQISDGGYIVTGWTGSYGAGSADFLILKLDSNGVQEWAKTFGGTGNDRANSIQQTLDSGYIVAGYTRSYGAGSTDSLILKLDSIGIIDNCSPPLADVFPVGETGPFATGETGPFATGETGPFATGETGPFATGETGPFAVGEVDVCLGCNTAPTVAAGAAVQPADYCGKAPQANLHWVFNDADGDGQGAFQVQVDEDALFGSPIINTVKIPGSANSYNTSLFITLAYNTTYHWRVKVWDDQVPGAESIYDTGTSFTTPPHKYPCADFTFSPASPFAGDVVSFDASAEGPCSCTGVGSQAYGAGIPITDYSWDFDGDSIIDANGALPTDNYTYAAEGSYSVELIVTDSSGFSCPSCAQTINVGKGMPKWKEVVPR